MNEEFTEISEEEFEKNFDKIMDLIETNKEHFLIRRADGSAVVAAPITEEMQPLLDIMPEMPYNGEVDEELPI